MVMRLPILRIILLIGLIGGIPLSPLSAQTDVQPATAVETTIEYDAQKGCYFVHKRLGGVDIELPRMLTAAEYLAWTARQSNQAYYRQRYRDEFKHKDNKQPFPFMNRQYSPKAADRVFGPGGIKLRMQGSAELQVGFTHTKVDNPTLPENQKNTWGVDFEEEVDANIRAQVGSKLDFNLNYNTNATFDFDSKNLKIKYEGDEDDIIKLVEAGNVSITSENSLIRGSSALFGIRTDLQFGRLNLQTVISQQQGKKKTVSSRRGVQTRTFDIQASDYEADRHFFLAHFFRDNYEKNLRQLPNITSGVEIKRIEVWITNRKSDYDNARCILAFADIAEGVHVGNERWGHGADYPSNSANALYSTFQTQYNACRNIAEIAGTLNGIGMEGGNEYEKLESARLLQSDEYTLNTKLGYISLKTTLQSDEILAVAYEYTYKGNNYQVGEFSSDIKESSQALYVKLLKSSQSSPNTIVWPLMMKNVYTLNASSIQKDKFQLHITYRNDSTSIGLKYLTEGRIASVPLIRVLGLDRINALDKPFPDGAFDFVDGYTIQAQDGRIFLPSTEPFGRDLSKQIGNDAIADKYVFEALYDSTQTVAKQMAERDKFHLEGTYSASGVNEIEVGTSITPGSLHVTAGGMELTENQDYIVDYASGIVTIINTSITDAGTPVSVELEGNDDFSLERKTMLGLNMSYDLSRTFRLGATLMRLTEHSTTSKVNLYEEPLSNTLWGLNIGWKTQSQWLTHLINRLPFTECSAPSAINLNVEFAKLVTSYGQGMQEKASYIDDFDNSQSIIDLRTPSYWMLASTPYSNEVNSLFPEASKSNDIAYGKNRALLSWYHIDALLTRRNSSLTPAHLKADLNQQSNHYVREIYEQEIFPNRETDYQETAAMNVLNLTYYPKERGPYNLDTRLNSDGTLLYPESRWGGMMRRLDTSDFEASNIEYITFWMLDPFIYDDAGNNVGAGNSTAKGGDLYINLGDLSEDILKDGRKSFENGLSPDGDTTQTDETVWGRVSRERSITYAFDSDTRSRRNQDVGLDGLPNDEESRFGTYANYLQVVQGIVSSQAYKDFAADPAGDNYHYFRGSDYDAEEKGIIERYKYFNNPEGNSRTPEDSGEKYNTAAKTTPDAEDVNLDYTMNETEKYYQYRISIRPADFVVGRNFITDSRKASVTLRNGRNEEVTWYQFKVPVRNGKAIGNIKDFKSIRFMRIFLTGFAKDITLRFATLELTRGEWRTYNDAIYNPKRDTYTTSAATFNVSTVGIEENANRTPVNYLLPPGISRVVDTSQPQLRQQDEQSVSMKVENLLPGDAKAIYKNTNLNLREYGTLKMFVHAEALTDLSNEIQDEEISLFIRLGSDYRSNYYEYEVPLKTTPHGTYTGSTGQQSVWPKENEIDLSLEAFTTLKRNRNRLKNTQGSGITYTSLYTETDNKHPERLLRIIGNPTLGEVRTIMIGVRNMSGDGARDAEVWVDEMRLADFNHSSGWALKGHLNVQLSDLGSINLQGHYATKGFGGLEDGTFNKTTDDYLQYATSTNIDAGRLLPKKLKLSAPIYYSFSKERKTPYYNPFDNDMPLDDALEMLTDTQAKDSLLTQTRETSTTRNFSISNLRFDIRSKNPMPYDPANFSFSYANSHSKNQDPTTAYENDLNWKGAINYTYAPDIKSWEPFKKVVNSRSAWLRFIREFNLNLLPQSVSFNSDISRHYYEMQLRDVEGTMNEQLGNMSSQESGLSISQQFLWNRNFSFNWRLTDKLQVNYTSATQAQIEEPYGVVNKNLYPDEYTAWKDSVKHSLLSLGTPLDYQQTFNVGYTLPLEGTPATDWLTADTRFASSYNWDRGFDLNDGTYTGNTISNQRLIDLNGRMDLERLYNKSKWLKAVNQRFRQGGGGKQQKEQQKALSTLDALKELAGRGRVVKDTLTQATPTGKQRWKERADNVLQYVARAAMSVRNINLIYRNSCAMTIPGFRPLIGDIFGQRRMGSRLAPGLSFAFGLNGESYIQEAIDNGWVITDNDSLSIEASSNLQEDFQLRINLEPLRDMKIELAAQRTWNRSHTFQLYVGHKGEPASRGNFSTSILSLASSFENPTASNNYHSAAFERFRENIPLVRNKLEEQYAGATYPAGTSLAGKPYDPTLGDVNPYSAEVMIPALLSAYSGRDAHKNSVTDIIPSIWKMIPGWRLTYTGLSRLPWIREHFNSITLTHAYKSTYSIGSYESYQTYHTYMGDLGFIEDVQTGQPRPSSALDIGMVSINEQFSPLIGLDMSMKNGMTTSVQLRKTRVLNLSMRALQLVEMHSKDFVFGAGYKIADFRPGRSRRRSRKNDMSHDLTIKADLSFRRQLALCRDIVEGNTQTTSGNRVIKFATTIDYQLSRLLTMRIYYDRQQTTPLVTSASYPITTDDFGVTFRFSLQR